LKIFQIGTCKGNNGWSNMAVKNRAKQIIDIFKGEKDV